LPLVVPPQPRHSSEGSPLIWLVFFHEGHEKSCSLTCLPLLAAAAPHPEAQPLTRCVLPSQGSTFNIPSPGAPLAQTSTSDSSESHIHFVFFCPPFSLEPSILSICADIAGAHSFPTSPVLSRQGRPFPMIFFNVLVPCRRNSGNACFLFHAGGESLAAHSA